MAEKSLLSEEYQNLIGREHPSYKDKLDDYTLFYQSFKGGSSFIIEENLFQHALEGSTAYTDRLKRGYYINFVKKIVDAFTNFIYMEGVKRPENPKLAPFLKNADGKDGDMDSFIKKTSSLSSVFGHCNVLIDSPSINSPTNKASLAEVKRNKLLPYAVNITPLEMPDWSFDKFGKYAWCLLKKEVYRDSNPLVDRRVVQEYTLITPTGQAIFSKEEGIIDTSKIVPGNVVPVIICNHGESDVDGFGESLITDIAYINRTIFNWCSIIDEMVEKQAFSQLVCPDDGSLEELQQTMLDAKIVTPDEDIILKKIGTSQIFTYPSNSGHPPQFISPDVRSLQTIWKMILEHINMMYLLTSLAGTREDMYSNSSKARQFIFSLVGNVLSAKASSLEKTENAMYKLYAKYMNFELGENDVAQYPKEFNVMTFAEYVEDMFSVIKKNVSQTFNEKLKNKVVDKFENLLTKSEKVSIAKEIKKAPKYAIGDKQGNVVYKEENELFSDLATGAREPGTLGSQEKTTPDNPPVSDE